MTKDREKAIKLCWNIAKERCPFHEEEMVNSFLEGFIDCIEYLLLQNTELKDYRLTTLSKQQTEMSKYALNLEHKLSWYDNQLTKTKEMIKELYESLDKLYLSGLSTKQIAFIEHLQDKTEQFLNSEVNNALS